MLYSLPIAGSLVICYTVYRQKIQRYSQGGYSLYEQGHDAGKRDEIHAAFCSPDDTGKSAATVL